MIKQTALSCGKNVPALGQGTWFLGDRESTRQREIDALRAGVSAGMTLIDTAEMYGSGRSEALVGDAIRGFDRDKLFLVSKVLPNHAGKKDMAASCENSLRRLKTDYLDLYLLHWRGEIPLAETVFCMEELKREGKIKNWGVSNFDAEDMEELWQIPNGSSCQVNQVLYHMGSRGIEFSLLPWMRAHHVALMAYCPLAQAGTLRRGLLSNPAVCAIARKHQVNVEQVLLAWCIRDGNTIAIPRSGKAEHTLQNAGAGSLILDGEDLARIDAQFAPPTRKMPLDIQ